MAETEGFPTALIRYRLGQEDAHYGGNLVAGATQLKVIGDLITELARTRNLKVPSRTTIWQYKGKSVDVREAGRALGVTAVLEGSIRRSGDDIRVVAQLIGVRDGFHLWARSYDRKASDPLIAQREISQSVAADLPVGPGPEPARAN